MALIVGKYIAPPPPPRGMSWEALYSWANRLKRWASTGNLLSSPVITSAAAAYYPKPWETVAYSVKRVDWQHYHVAFWLMDSTGGSRVQRPAQALIGIPRTAAYDWQAQPVNNSVAFSGMSRIATLVSNAVYAVQLHSTADNIVKVSHTATDFRQVCIGIVGGKDKAATVMRFSTSP
ncbi:MAG: hypothetical protein M0R06_05225 [Sphaerochaeta sp.]|nr:hypothetical protein [Sphaerochaeta sp.]